LRMRVPHHQSNQAISQLTKRNLPWKQALNRKFFLKLLNLCQRSKDTRMIWTKSHHTWRKELLTLSIKKSREE
jgi:hypothetical protein